METIRRKNEGETTYQVRKIAGVSIRRVNQVYAEYLKTEKLPEIGKSNGRPRRQIRDWERKLVSISYQKYRVCAGTLERLIDRDYGKHISHNRIHKIMLELDFAKPANKNHIRKKKWKRYERRHSLTAVHIDWHFSSKNRKWIFAVIDDASRKILSLIEGCKATTENSILGTEQALKYGPIKQCISDHGSQFTSNILDGNSKFKTYLKSRGIKQILCKIKHPQSNGKIEKWFDTYDRNRHAFENKENFLEWYNEIRPHMALRFNVLETPEQAFQRKLKAEV